jgi:hypothetical protein
LPSCSRLTRGGFRGLNTRFPMHVPFLENARLRD